ncbi:hypothetical protein GBBBJNDB_00290 [Pseudomonas phage Callisto]|nr:hypothetical protein GBBBJNDB_00290 [Pseudomonas phage Callisto]
MGPIEQDFQNFGPSFFGDVRVHRNMYYIIHSLFVHYHYLISITHYHSLFVHYHYHSLFVHYSFY